MKVGLINWNRVYCPATFFHTVPPTNTAESNIDIPLRRDGNWEIEREENTRSVGDILATQGEHVIIGQDISVAAWLCSGAVFWTYLIGSPLIDCHSSTEAWSTWEQYENMMGCHVWTDVLGGNMKSDINSKENGLLLNLNICIKIDHY